MLSDSPDQVAQKSLQIKQDDKFFSRLLSKESSMTNPSFRVYYGGVTGSVPFLWESQPGTPKHPLSTTSLPPLTPPPSYYSHNPKHPSKKYSRSKFLHSLFLRVNLKKPIITSSPSSMSSSSWSSTASNYYGRRRFSSTDSSYDERCGYEEDAEEVPIRSPTSIFCFGGGKKTYSVVVMKKALMGMVGRGSG